MKTRVAYLGVKGLPSKSGTERVIEAVATRLAHEFDITVYCGADYTPAETHYEGIRLIRIQTLKGKHLKPVSLNILSALHAFFFGRFDLIHMNGVENCFTLPLLKLRYRIISTSHGNPGRLPANKWNSFDRFVLRLMEYPFLYVSDCPTVVSPMDRDDFKDRYKKEIAYIPNGVDVEPQIDQEAALQFLEDFRLVPNGFLLFIAGRMIERKGCHLLLEAVNELALDMPVVVIGDMEHASIYGQKLRQLAENRNVIFIPPIEERPKLFGIMALCKLFIFPSTSEGMSMILLEAASLGVPMICSDIPENKAVLGDHVTYFRSESVADLAEKILWGIKNGEKLSALEGPLKEWVEENFSWDRIALQYEHIYDQVSHREEASSKKQPGKGSL